MVTVHIGSAESWVHNVGQNQVRMVKFALCNGNFGSWTTHDLARYHDSVEKRLFETCNDNTERNDFGRSNQS